MSLPWKRREETSLSLRYVKTPFISGTEYVLRSLPVREESILNSWRNCRFCISSSCTESMWNSSASSELVSVREAPDANYLAKASILL